METMLFSVLLLWAIASSAQAAGNYFGVEIGKLTEFAHDVRGKVFAVDDKTILIRGFHYDGKGPDAFFWVGNGTQPSRTGTAIPYPGNSNLPLKQRFSGEDVILNLPEGIQVSTINYISVWCRRFRHNFGHVVLRKDLNIPKPQTIPGFVTIRNGVRSASVVVEDDRTVNLPSFSYDGQGGNAFFIAGKGNTPSITGDIVILPADENGRSTPLREYGSKDIKLKFPPDRSITEFNWISVYSRDLDENLGHISLPRPLRVPPSLEGIVPNAGPGNSQADADSLPSLMNPTGNSQADADSLPSSMNPTGDSSQADADSHPSLTNPSGNSQAEADSLPSSVNPTGDSKADEDSLPSPTNPTGNSQADEDSLPTPTSGFRLASQDYNSGAQQPVSWLSIAVVAAFLLRNIFMDSSFPC